MQTVRPAMMLPPSSHSCPLTGQPNWLHLGPAQLLDEASEDVVLKAAGFGGWRDRTKAVYAQEVQSWHGGGRCILVPGAEAALWPRRRLEWVLGFANSHPSTSGMVSLGSFSCNCPPKSMSASKRSHAEWQRRTANAVVSFCGSVVFPSCPQGTGDPGSAWARGLRN